MPPLPGLRASSLPPAPGYESDEEGGLCNGKAERRTLQDVLPCFITLSVSRGRNERVSAYTGGERITSEARHVRWLVRCAAVRRSSVYTVPLRVHGIPLTSPRRPISISIKGGAHVPLLENARGINDSATRAPYESTRRDTATGEYSLAMLGYSASVRRVIITGSRAAVREKTPSKLPQGPVPRIDDARPVSGTGLIVPRPSCCFRALRPGFT